MTPEILSNKQLLTKYIATQVFLNAMSQAEGLGLASENERDEAFKVVSEISIEAASTFVDQLSKI